MLQAFDDRPVPAAQLPQHRLQQGEIRRLRTLGRRRRPARPSRVVALQHGHAQQAAPRGCVRRRDRGQLGHGVDRPVTLAVEDQQRRPDERLRSGEKDVGDLVSAGPIHRVEQPRRLGTLRGDHHRVGFHPLAIGEDDGNRLEPRYRRPETQRTGRQTGCELLSDGTDAGCWDGGRARGEHPEDELELPAGGGQGRVELDPAEERAEEGGDHALGEAGGTQPLEGGGLGTPPEVREGTGHAPLPQDRDPRLVRERADGCAQRCEHRRGRAQRVGHVREPPVHAHQSAGLEAAQVERRVVQRRRRLGVGLQQDLEAAVELEAVDDVGAYPPADPVGRFVHRDLDPGVGEQAGGPQAGQPGTDDGDRCHRAQALPRRWRRPCSSVEWRNW